TAGCLIARQAQVGGRPLGYDLSLIGIAIFFVGGIGDGIWHTIFGFEQKVDSLFSPTHLLIATGGVLLLTGPLRASWSRPGGQVGDQIPWPALLSLLYAFNTVLLFVEYSHPFYSPALFAGPEPTSGDLALQSEMHAVLGV